MTRVRGTPFKSTLEHKVSLLLGEKWQYESHRIPYIMRRTYSPDFTKGKIHIEVKGVFRPGDISKYLAIKASMHPKEELVFVFSNPNKKVRKGAKLSMGQWAEKNGFRWFGVNDLHKVRI